MAIEVQAMLKRGVGRPRKYPVAEPVVAVSPQTVFERKWRDTLTTAQLGALLEMFGNRIGEIIRCDMMVSLKNGDEIRIRVLEE